MRSRIAAAGAGALLLAACSVPMPGAVRAGSEGGEVRVFDAALLIPGNGPPIENARLVARDGMIEAVGPRDSMAVPAGAVRVDLSHRTLMPTLVNVHGHVGYMHGAETASEHYSRENVLDHLRRSMYYGVGAVQSLGTDRDGTEIAIRNEQRAGTLADPELALLFTAGAGVVAPTPGSVNGGPFFATDVVLEAATPDEAHAHVRRLAISDPDIVKLWVDDRGGTRAKLQPAVYRAVIAEAHAHGLRAVAHVYDLDDAKGLVDADVDGFAHMVRTEPGIDDALVAAIREAGVFQCSTLSIQKRLVDDPSWIDDPALAETVRSGVIAKWRDGLQRASSTAVERARADYARLEASLRRLHAGGARIVLCGDTGLLSQAPGYTEHRELEAIVQTGVPPLGAIRAATHDGAQVLGLTDRGTLAPGRRADFLVLDGNPLDAIANTRRIAAVYRNAVALDRDAMRTRWSDPDP